ncbi:MAG TPA: glycoside hydrolase family 130 protein [Bacteroidales bacterium]|nr:glycoside hydrolase family 130 protein [Bacteroidales bacterium]
MKKYLFIIAFICLSCTINKPQNEAMPGWELEGFVKVDSINPIMKPSDELVFTCPVSKKEVHWEGRNVFNPAAVVKDGKVYLLYRAQDNDMTSRIGLAVSEDGLHFAKQPQPVFFPDNDSLNRYEWKGGVEDPRVVMSPEGKYVMTYTAYDGKTARLCLATSDDLFHWEKHGLVLSQPEYRDTWSKSGAIISRLEGNEVKATKINGKYWMYFGDTDLFIAYSEDLLHWKAARDSESGKMIRVLNPRPGYFDSRLVEPGPFALERDSGILLIYNSSNAADYNDPSLPEFTYSAGQALFSKKDPVRLEQRSARYFIHPDKPYEKTGEVNEVCFVEGLVRFREHWFLYYGTADSRIAVAVK